MYIFSNKAQINKFAIINNFPIKTSFGYLAEWFLNELNQRLLIDW